jgi:flagellar motor component MotA
VFGHLGATIASFPFEATQNLGKYVGKAMKGKDAHSASETITRIVVLTEPHLAGN